MKPPPLPKWRQGGATLAQETAPLEIVGGWGARKQPGRNNNEGKKLMENKFSTAKIPNFSKSVKAHLYIFQIYYLEYTYITVTCSCILLGIVYVDAHYHSSQYNKSLCIIEQCT